MFVMTYFIWDNYFSLLLRYNPQLQYFGIISTILNNLFSYIWRGKGIGTGEIHALRCYDVSYCYKFHICDFWIMLFWVHHTWIYMGGNEPFFFLNIIVDLILEIATSKFCKNSTGNIVTTNLFLFGGTPRKYNPI